MYVENHKTEHDYLVEELQDDPKFMEHLRETELENQCKAFNDAYPVGSTVKVTKDDGSLQETKTRSQAFVMGGHTPMVQLEGISGSYQLNRVAA